MKRGNKVFMALFGTVTAIGAIVILGAVGSSDANMIGVYDLGIRLVQGYLVALVGLAGMVVTVAREERS